MIEFGTKVKHKHSPFKGVVTARFEWANGCVRYEVTSSTLESGKPVIGAFDEDDLEVVKRKAPAKVSKPTGGPRQGPSRRSGPRRSG